MKGDRWSRYVPRCGNMGVHRYHYLDTRSLKTLWCMGMDEFGQPFGEELDDARD